VVQASDHLLLPFDRDRLAAIAGQPIDAGANEEMRIQLLRQAEQFVDVALSVTNVNAFARIAQKIDRLATDCQASARFPSSRSAPASD